MNDLSKPCRNGSLLGRSFESRCRRGCLILLILLLASIFVANPPVQSSTAAAFVPNVQSNQAKETGTASDIIEQFMEQKLEAAQSTLEAVMTNRFQQIQENAAKMVDLSRHAAWKQLSSASYVQDTADFVAAAEYLSRTAAAEDTEGTILAFNRLTSSCASCHQHVRRPRVAAVHGRSEELQLLADD